MSDEAIVIRSHGWTSILGGVLCLALAIFFPVMTSTSSGSQNDFWLNFLFWSTVPLFLAIKLIGTGLRKPVILRMDNNGISGYEVPPARWTDIAEVAPFSVKNRTCVGFNFVDPDQILMQMSAWRRFWRTHGHFRSGFDLLVLMEPEDQDRTVTFARRFLATGK